MLQPVVNAEVHDTLEQRLWIEANNRGYTHERHAAWPAHPGALAVDVDGELLASFISHGVSRALYHHGDALARVQIDDGMVHVNAAAGTSISASECVDWLRSELVPYESADDGVVPVTFWTATPHGGRSIRRDIDASSWTAIEENYPSADGLVEMMSPSFRPGVGGQLVLWHGEPGTGKTTALRAVAREWREWCDLDYIVDPEVFFGSRSDYMMEVLTTESVDYKSPGDSSRPRWRMLVLEDCGELLQPDAKREVGQALARLLNACDGLIGRGLRILVLLTTNEPAEKLHEAVARPGRCAARVEFQPFSALAAAQWLEKHGVEHGALESMALADLYARLEGFRERQLSRAVGFAA